MPYILKTERENFKESESLGMKCNTPGDLNYVITKVIHGYLNKRGLIKYQYINDILGALSGATLEFYRRIVVPYEDTKINNPENGDV